MFVHVSVIGVPMYLPMHMLMHQFVNYVAYAYVDANANVNGI